MYIRQGQAVHRSEAADNYEKIRIQTILTIDTKDIDQYQKKKFKVKIG